MPRKKKTEVEIEKQSVEVIENVENEADTDVEAVKNEDSEYENTAVSNESAVLQENEPIAKKTVKRRKRKTEAEKEDAEELRDTLALLRGGKQKMTIYSRMLERIETNENTVDPGVGICAIAELNGIKVMIPAKEMGITVDESLSPSERSKAYKRYLAPMLGSDIDFVVQHIDAKNKIAVGSRDIAMKIKKNQFFIKKTRAGSKTQAEYYMEKALKVPATVLAVAGSTVKVEVFGVETKVFSRDADWRYTANLATLFTPGDKINVIIKNFAVELPEGTKDPNVKLEVSIKEATPNRIADNIKNYREGSICVGTISGVTEKGYYISLGDHKTGIDAFCTTVLGNQIPQIGDKVACQIIKINVEDCFAVAKINRIIQVARR